jgi:hypothetical protein
MALSAATGTLNVTTASAGNTVAVSGLGFQPSCLIFFWSGRTATGSGRASQQRGFGVAVSPTERWAVASQSVDAAASADTDAAHSESNCIITIDTAGAITGTMDLQSFDSGGFTLVIDAAFAANYLVHYLALGGSSLTGAKTGRFTATGTAPVTQSVTVDTGFTPTCVLFASTNHAANPPASQIDSRLGLGAMTGSTEEGAWTGGSNSAANTMQTMSYCYGSECIALANSTMASVSERAEFSSFDTNGFTINWLERATAARIYYLALKGVDAFIGNLLTQTDTTTAIAESGFGFRPSAVMAVSHGQAQSTQDTAQDHDMLSVGFAVSASARTCGTTHDEDGIADSQVTLAASTAAVYENIDTSNAVVGAMDVQSFDSDGFTCIMDDADPSQAFVWYLALGPAAVTAYSLSAESGSFSVTGTAATLRASRRLTADASSFAVSGTAAGLRADRKLSAAAGSYAVTGTDATLTHQSGFTLLADSGSFSVTGTAAALTAQRRLNAEAGAFSVTGTAAGLQSGRRLTAESGAYALAGEAASLLAQRRLIAAAGSYALTGLDAGLRAARQLAAQSGAYAISGADVSLIQGELPSADLLGVTAEALRIAGAAGELLREAGAAGELLRQATATNEDLRPF